VTQISNPSPLRVGVIGAGWPGERHAEAYLASGARAGELKPPDPLLDDVDAALESAVAYEVRGARALNTGDWNAAVQLFRRGLELSPNEPSLRHKLGTALALAGDQEAAFETFQETARRSPSFVKARYSLALIYAASGQVSRAVDEFNAALHYEPDYVEAHLQLAELLRHTGKPAAALPHYERAVTLDPRLAEARYGQAMALIQLRRYRDARDRLAVGVSRHPDHPGFAVALARVLAAAPDDTVRDGPRALSLLQGVPADTQRTFDWGMAMAMALAENGRYEDAVMVQQQALEIAAGDPRMTRRLTETLRRYQQRQPCAAPWSEPDSMELIDRPEA